MSKKERIQKLAEKIAIHSACSYDNAVELLKKSKDLIRDSALIAQMSNNGFDKYVIKDKINDLNKKDSFIKKKILFIQSFIFFFKQNYNNDFKHKSWPKLIK